MKKDPSASFILHSSSFLLSPFPMPPPLPITVPPAAMGPDARGDRHPVLRVALGALAVIACAVLLYFKNPTPAAGGTSFYPSCPFHKLTGLYCPGCGATRALHHLLHGRVAVAFDYNPLLVVTLPLLLYLMVSGAVRTLWPEALPPRRPLTPAGMWTILLIVFTFAVLRNLPYPPLAWMAP